MRQWSLPLSCMLCGMLSSLSDRRGCMSWCDTHLINHAYFDPRKKKEKKKKTTHTHTHPYTHPHTHKSPKLELQAVEKCCRCLNLWSKAVLPVDRLTSKKSENCGRSSMQQNNCRLMTDTKTREPMVKPIRVPNLTNGPKIYQDKNVKHGQINWWLILRQEGTANCIQQSIQQS